MFGLFSTFDLGCIQPILPQQIENIETQF